MVSNFPAWPVFDESELKAVSDVLVSGRVNYWTGKQGKRFEQAFSSFLGCAHSIALANGTLALELALRALDLKAGDEVVVPSRTFIATASAVVACGAKPICADVDAASQTLTVETIRAACSNNTKAVIVVHLAGWPCDMPRIMAFAKEKGLHVIEDCAQAHGASISGQYVGTWGDFGVFSFCQDKIMTTGGEGGMLTTCDEALWKRAWSLKDHGKDYDLVFNTSHPPGYRWLHSAFGTNFRMTEMQAAIGRMQLKKLPKWLEKRREHASRLTTLFSGFPFLRTEIPDAHVQHAYYKYYTFVRAPQLPAGWSRDRIVQALNASGVPCFTGSCPEIYRERAFVDRGWAPMHRHPVAKQLGEDSLMFLVHPTITTEQMSQIIANIQRVLDQVVVKLGEME